MDIHGPHGEPVEQEELGDPVRHTVTHLAQVQRGADNPPYLGQHLAFTGFALQVGVQPRTGNGSRDLCCDAFHERHVQLGVRVWHPTREEEHTDGRFLPYHRDGQQGTRSAIGERPDSRVLLQHAIFGSIIERDAVLRLHGCCCKGACLRNRGVVLVWCGFPRRVRDARSQSFAIEGGSRKPVKRSHGPEAVGDELEDLLQVQRG